MPNIATVLKEEIARVARKELRAATDSLKKSSSQHRSDLASIKRRLASAEKEIKKLRKAAGASGRAGARASQEESGEGGRAFRFSAKGLAAQRQRLGLSAAQVALLLGVSGQSIYKWEAGAAKPRASQFAAISKLRTMGKREALAQLGAATGE
ncbi:MAG: helix-turn-helix transcriptional regulator [Rhodoferax sp.]|jgi:DNA-binding transcriptional regulator YiaG|nr:helix-turn-helix transcriptional regulator [Pseudomonadota bacterium]MCB1995847.1 helix-turn-helix transcriptional regulator [Rhodoferax sp.]MCB2006627.1 helix-turn-helix transcriptional regulator [Rhodoferax sp.]MCB2029852.1 helix-turn-helix transcriptional regulator [Rhodoferax sp.]MCB2039318.1 helix-turn-helix transcriptional regulator [Rhodoferax sp.]